jgi:hypothetical protein
MRVTRKRKNLKKKMKGGSEKLFDLEEYFSMLLRGTTLINEKDQEIVWNEIASQMEDWGMATSEQLQKIFNTYQVEYKK